MNVRRTNVNPDATKLGSAPTFQKLQTEITRVLVPGARH
jgi:hypothetical protein